MVRAPLSAMRLFLAVRMLLWTRNDVSSYTVLPRNEIQDTCLTVRGYFDIVSIYQRASVMVSELEVRGGVVGIGSKQDSTWWLPPMVSAVAARSYFLTYWRSSCCTPSRQTNQLGPVQDAKAGVSKHGVLS